jgi:hypothetical protein
MRSCAAAEALCEARAPYRLAKSKPIHAKRAQKTRRGDPVMPARLANAYVRTGGDDEKAARILGDGRFGPAGQNTSPRSASNGPSPESLLSGRRSAAASPGATLDRQRHALRGSFLAALTVACSVNDGPAVRHPTWTTSLDGGSRTAVAVAASVLVSASKASVRSHALKEMAGPQRT